MNPSEPSRSSTLRHLLRRGTAAAVVAAVLALPAGCTTSQAQPRRPDRAAAPAPTSAAAPAPVPQLPGGGTRLCPGRRIVALYGHPGTPGMDVLGEQGIAASITRARRLAASATVATPSCSPGRAGATTSGWAR